AGPGVRDPDRGRKDRRAHGGGDDRPPDSDPPRAPDGHRPRPPRRPDRPPPSRRRGRSPVPAAARNPLEPSAAAADTRNSDPGEDGLRVMVEKPKCDWANREFDPATET